MQKYSKNIDLKNTLDKASSAYLTSAQHQPVHWQEWGEKAFEFARKLDKPVLLDIGAVWCHWCHVMDRESYENEDTAAIINKNFIAVKIDRDEQPDVDQRFQTFVQAMSESGGWPLTCFLTPDGKPFYGGTYFPPEDRYGKPAFKNVLINLAKAYQDKKQNLLKKASDIFDQIAAYEKIKSKSGELSKDVISSILSEIIQNFDPVYGGFGPGPKFPSGSSINLSLLTYSITQDENYLTVAKTTLDNMAAGGIHDHLGGGFHRYSVDQFWHVPHFEKMTTDNAEFLINYLDIYKIVGDERYKTIIEGIIRYYTEDMCDKKAEGFYAHQDADITLEDDGDYFTWTKKEITEHLSPAQASVFNTIFGISDKPGDLHGSPERNVLYTVKSLHGTAEELKISEENVEKILDEAQSNLLKVRYKRQAPYIDKTIFANYNGMMISAFVQAYKTFRNEELKQRVVKTLNFLIKNLYSPKTGFCHSYVNGSRNNTGLLSDQVWMTTALLDGFEISGDIRYFDHACRVMDMVLDTFYDTEQGGFLDRVGGTDPSPVMGIQHKPFEDVPVASSNSVAVRILDRLFTLTGKERYRLAAEKTLQSFSGSIERRGMYLASFGISLFHHLFPPPQVIIIKSGHSEQHDQLVKAAYSVNRPGISVYVFDAGERSNQKLPPPVKSKISGTKGSENSVAYVCAGTNCAPPTGDSEELVKLLSTFGQSDTELEYYSNY